MLTAHDEKRGLFLTDDQGGKDGIRREQAPRGRGAHRNRTGDYDGIAMRSLTWPRLGSSIPGLARPSAVRMIARSAERRRAAVTFS